jgi:hypothetical protein
MHGKEKNESSSFPFPAAVEEVELCPISQALFLSFWRQQPPQQPCKIYSVNCAAPAADSININGSIARPVLLLLPQTFSSSFSLFFFFLLLSFFSPLNSSLFVVVKLWCVFE